MDFLEGCEWLERWPMLDEGLWALEGGGGGGGDAGGSSSYGGGAFMSMSNFPGGFADGVSLRGLPLTVTHPGKVWWVGNSTVLAPNQKGASDSNDGTYNAPFSTLQRGLDMCTASRGDVVFVKPGHAETISSAAILTFNKAGVAIVGLGSGNLRPTFTFTTATTANIPVSAANVSVRNLLFVANFAAIASCFTTAAAPEFTVDSCEFRDTSSILNFVAIVTTTVSVDADGLMFVNNKVLGLGTTAATTPIKIAGTIARLNVSGNFIILAALSDTASLIAQAALVVTQAVVRGNVVYRWSTSTTGGFLISGSATTCTGIVADNYAACALASGALLFATGLKYSYFNNLIIGDADASGYVLPAIGAN